MKHKNIYSALKTMMKAAMFIVIFIAAIQVGGFYVDYKADNPQGNIMSFVTHKEVEKYDSIGGVPSDKFIEKVSIYNSIVRTVWFALFFYVMFEIFSYLSNKKEYWLVQIWKKLPKDKEGAEDGETNI